MNYFDYKKIAGQAGIPQDKFEGLCASIGREFPEDQMMYELHMLRACMAIKEGLVTIDEALEEHSRKIRGTTREISFSR